VARRGGNDNVKMKQHSFSFCWTIAVIERVKTGRSVTVLLIKPAYETIRTSLLSASLDHSVSSFFGRKIKVSEN